LHRPSLNIGQLPRRVLGRHLRRPLGLARLVGFRLLAGHGPGKPSHLRFNTCVRGSGQLELFVNLLLALSILVPLLRELLANSVKGIESEDYKHDEQGENMARTAQQLGPQGSCERLTLDNDKP